MSEKNGLAWSKNKLSLTDSHEDRLQHVESTLNKVAIDVAKIDVNQTHISKALDAQTEALDAQTEILLGKLDNFHSKVGAFEDRLIPFEQQVAVNKNRKEHIQTIIKGALMALVGAIAAGIGAKLLELWGPK